MLSPALLALLSAPPSAGMAVHEGKGLWNQMGASEISHKLLRLFVGKQGMECAFLESKASIEKPQGLCSAFPSSPSLGTMTSWGETEGARKKRAHHVFRPGLHSSHSSQEWARQGSQCLSEIRDHRQAHCLHHTPLLSRPVC